MACGTPVPYFEPVVAGRGGRRCCPVRRPVRRGGDPARPRRPAAGDLAARSLPPGRSGARGHLLLAAGGRGSDRHLRRHDRPRAAHGPSDPDDAEAAGPGSIGVVAYEMEGAPTGVGRYLEELLTALRGTPRARDWRLRPVLQGGSLRASVVDRRGGGGLYLRGRLRSPRRCASDPLGAGPTAPHPPASARGPALLARLQPAWRGFSSFARHDSRRVVRGSAARLQFQGEVEAALPRTPRSPLGDQGADRHGPYRRRTSAALRPAGGADRVAPLGVAPRFGAGTTVGVPRRCRAERASLRAGVRRPVPAGSGFHPGAPATRPGAGRPDSAVG